MTLVTQAFGAVMGGLHRQQTRGWGEEAHGAHTDKNGGHEVVRLGTGVPTIHTTEESQRGREGDEERQSVVCVQREEGTGDEEKEKK